MAYALVIDGLPTEWDGKPWRDSWGYGHPANAPALYSKEELALADLYEIEEPGPIPDGAYVSGSTLVWDETTKTVFRQWQLTTIPQPSLQDSKAAKIEQARQICQAKILGGFFSAGLGVLHQYPSQMTDQINLMGSVTASLLPDLPSDWSTPFWCADASDVWAMRPHTVGEIQTVGRDGKSHVLTCQQRLDALAFAIASAADQAALDAIDVTTGW